MHQAGALRPVCGQCLCVTMLVRSALDPASSQAGRQGESGSWCAGPTHQPSLLLKAPGTY